MVAREAGELRSLQLPAAPCWVEPRLLLKGSLTMFAGPAACGKTFMMLEMADNLASGQKLFGHFDVPVATRVLLVEQEVGLYGMQERLISKYPNEKVAPKGFFIATKDPTVSVDDPAGFENLRTIVEKVGPGVMILDPITRFMTTGEEENNSSIARLIRCLDRLLMGYPEMAVVFTHHFRKDPQEPPDGWNDLDMMLARGGAKWADAPDLRVTMRCDRREEGRPSLWRTQWVPRHGPEFKLGLKMGNDFRIRAATSNVRFGL